MIHTYGVARLSENPALLDLALWLAQSDNLHLIQWFGRSGPEAEVSAYFTPREWWELGPDRILLEQQRVYENCLRAMEYHLPQVGPRRANVRPPRRARSSSRQPLGVESRYLAADRYFGALHMCCRYLLLSLESCARALNHTHRRSPEYLS